MKRQSFVLFSSVVMLLFVVSCTPQAIGPKNLYVTIENGSAFPEYLVGTWIQEGDQKRAFTFTSDGKLESIVLGLGQVKLKPGQVTTISLKNDGQGVFYPGVWTASYDSKTRQLGIEINIDSFKMQMGQQIVEGKMKELFIGTISEDGTMWNAQYICFPEYYATTETVEKKLIVSSEDMQEEAILLLKSRN
ncbi:MAG TPA: hypothetical protein PKB02_18545 [Anaerohalosphaeraceae bacterium]|nr:hypothetical protein [Anaerohalosphaeraceae bacterium]